MSHARISCGKPQQSGCNLFFLQDIEQEMFYFYSLKLSFLSSHQNKRTDIFVL